MAKISGLPTTDKLTGAEHLPIVQGNATKRVTMAAFRDLITPFLQYWYKGDKGDTGAANSTYTTKAALTAAPIANGSYIFAPPNGEENGLAAGTFLFRSGDYRGLVDDKIIVALTGVPLDLGALVRQGAESLNFDGRPVDAKLRETISVTDARFLGGARGDGVTNDTMAIMMAQAAATARGADLFFPAPKVAYMIDQLVGTTNWIGERGTIIKHRGSGTGYIPMVEFRGLTSPMVQNIIFDGNVSADPESWALGYDKFTGAAGIRFILCTRPKLVDVRAQNCSWSGISLVNCEGFSVTRCETERTRGNFGDGLFIVSCQGGSVTDFTPQDFTRIGLVLDSFGEGESIITCQKITLSRIYPKNGHHGSAIFGGSEFNAGIWAENSADMTVSDVFPVNCGHRGVNVCTGPKPKNFPGTHAMVVISNVHSVGGIWGTLVYSLNDLPIDAKVSHCSTKQSQFAFEAIARNGADKFVWTACRADYDAASVVGRGFVVGAIGVLAGVPSFEIAPGCSVSRWRENPTFLNAPDDSASTADVGTNVDNASAISLRISGLENVDGSPVYVKWFGNFRHAMSFANMKISIPCGIMGFGDFNLSKCRSYNIAVATAGRSEVEGGVVLGSFYLRSTSIRFDADVDIEDKATIRLVSPQGGNFPAIAIESRQFQKDVVANGPIFDIDASAGAATTVTGSRFYNKGGASASARWMTVRAGSGAIDWVGVRLDASIDTLYAKLDGVDPIGVAGTAGVSKMVMH